MEGEGAQDRGNSSERYTGNGIRQAGVARKCIRETKKMMTSNNNNNTNTTTTTNNMGTLLSRRHNFIPSTHPKKNWQSINACSLLPLLLIRISYLTSLGP